MSPPADKPTMNNVIIVKGASGRGKTPTLNNLISLLIEKYSAELIFEEYLFSSNKDRFVILQVPNYGKVGIITYGDTGSECKVKEALKKCEDCHALVAASHTRYYTPNETVYQILWDYGHDVNAKIVETSTIVKYENWGQHIEEDHINKICAKNIANILFEL